MNYIEIVKNILEKEQDYSTTILDLSNSLIPRLMYISNNDIPEIILLLDQQNSLIKQESIDPLSIVIKSLLNYKKSNYQLSLQLVNDILDNPYFNISDKLRAASYSIIGINHRSVGERDTAFNFFQKALELYPDTADTAYINYLYGINLYHIAEIYGELKEYNEMLDKQELFYKTALKFESPDLENRALNGLGRAYIGLGSYDVALSYFQTANENAKKIANISFIGRSLHDLGLIFNLLGDTKQSLFHYKEALKIRTENGYQNAAITTQIAISEVLMEQEKYTEAIDILERAKATAESMKVKRKLCSILEDLAKANEKIQNFEKALVYHKTFHQLKVELDNVDKTQLESQRVREANTQLKQQKALIQDQKQQIEITLEKLKINNKYLENFAAVAAHDLKAPIRIASSFARIIERKYNDRWDKSDAEFFSYITTNIGKLGQMIDDLLALSKLDQDLLPAQEVDISTILKDVEKRLSEKVVETRAVVKCQNTIPKLMAHRSLMTQLFQNLIDNAIKYGGDKKPKVVINTEIQEDGFCQFEIQDNGKGIPLNEQKHIFELFTGTNRSDSTGIGLATCKKIVTHYGGNIWLKSEENIGTSIFFTLPFVA